MVGVSDVGVMAIIAVGVRAGNQNCVVVGQCVLDQSGEEETSFEHGEEGNSGKPIQPNFSLALNHQLFSVFSVYISQIFK